MVRSIKRNISISLVLLGLTATIYPQQHSSCKDLLDSIHSSAAYGKKKWIKDALDKVKGATKVQAQEWLKCDNPAALITRFASDPDLNDLTFKLIEKAEYDSNSSQDDVNKILKSQPSSNSDAYPVFFNAQDNGNWELFPRLFNKFCTKNACPLSKTPSGMGAYTKVDHTPDNPQFSLENIVFNIYIHLTATANDCNHSPSSSVSSSVKDMIDNLSKIDAGVFNKYFKQESNRSKLLIKAVGQAQDQNKCLTELSQSLKNIIPNMIVGSDDGLVYTPEEKEALKENLGADYSEGDQITDKDIKDFVTKDISEDFN